LTTSPRSNQIVEAQIDARRRIRKKQVQIDPNAAFADEGL
jgi:hypothetical protein